MIPSRDIIKQLYDAMLARRLDLLGMTEESQQCSRYTPQHCADYLDLLMPQPERDRFEQHYPACTPCLRELVAIIDADSQIGQDVRFTETGCRISRSRALAYAATHAPNAEPLLLAAASRHSLSSRGASGIGVDPRSGQGQILDCVAHVYDDPATPAMLQVIGCQVVEREIDGRRVGVTPPLRMIQDVLGIVFKSNPQFKKHRAAERSITVQVTQPHESFLSEGLSLSLAAAAAVYAALEERSLPDELVMSGCLDINGRIRKVSHVSEKVFVALQQGKTHVVLPCENIADVERLDPDIRRQLAFSFVDTLQDLFECLAQPATGPEQPVSAGASPDARGRLIERLYRIDKYPLSFGLFLCVLCAGWLGGIFTTAADYALQACAGQIWAGIGLPAFTLLTALVWAIIAARPEQGAGLPVRMLFYVLLLLFIPLVIATVQYFAAEQAPVVSAPQYAAQDEAVVLLEPEQILPETPVPDESAAVPQPEEADEAAVLLLTVDQRGDIDEQDQEPDTGQDADTAPKQADEVPDSDESLPIPDAASGAHDTLQQPDDPAPAIEPYPDMGFD